MASTSRRKTVLTLDAEVLDCAKAPDINVSAVASAQLAEWLKENAPAFEAQSAWHERHGHSLAEIMSAPGGASWGA